MVQTMKTKSACIVGRVIAGGALLLAVGASYAGTLHFSPTSILPFDDYVRVGSQTNLKVTGSSLTLEAWIKPTGRGSDAIEGGIILGREGEYMLARFPDGTIQYAVATTTPGLSWNAGSIVPTNQWTHVALTYDGSFLTLYTNGVLRGLTPASGPVGDTNAALNDFWIGNRQALPRYFQGQIDEVRVWNVTRSQADISAYMTRPLQGNEPGLLAYYRFEEGFGATTADATGSGLTGTLVNGPVWDSASESLRVPVPMTRPAALVTETAARLNGSISTNGILATNSFWLATNTSTALSFDGVDDSVSFSLGPNNNYSAYPLTVTAWLKTDRPGASGGIVNKYTSGSLNGWQLGLVNGQLRAFYFRNANTNVFGGGDGLNGGNVDDGQWHHVAFAVGPAGGKLYVDGLLTATTAWVGTPAATINTQPLRLGVYDSHFAGQLDEITLWNTELSAVAISGLMTSPPTPAHPQYASLVAHWPLDEGSGMFVNDARGRNAAGISVGEPQWVPQARPDAYAATPLAPVRGTNSVLDLDGLDDHVRVPAGIWFSNEFTIETWVYARSFNSYSRVIDFGNGAPSDNVLFVASQGTTGRPEFVVYRGATAQFITAPDPLPINQWVHLGVTLRSNTATILVNGVAVVSGTVTAPNAVTRNNNYIGRSNWAVDGYANALYDDLRLWKVARTPAQIRQFMTEPVAPDDPNLVLNYRFDEPAGLAAVDSRTTSPQNGTLTNGASRLAFERTSVDLAGLTPGTKHYFSSVATSTNGAQYGPLESFATLTPAAGTALEFDGMNSLVRIAGFGTSMPTTNVTVEFWQRVHSLGNHSSFGLEPDIIANRFQAHVPFGDGVVYWDFGNISANGRLSYLPPVSLVGTWQHFALVAKSPPNGYMRIYRNGVLEAQTITASSFALGTRDLVLGRLTGYFDGELDEFRIWNAARDGTNILRDFNRRLLGNEPGLVAYYRMDEGAGSVLADATGRGKDGLLLNNPEWVPSTAPVGWPLVTTSDVNHIVLGDVTLDAEVKGDASTATRTWVEYGQYMPVPNSAANFFYGYAAPSLVDSLSDVNFNAPPLYAGTFTNIALAPTFGPVPEWPGGPTEFFAVRYLGRVFLPATGTYTFYCASDDGSDLYLDGQLLINNDGLHPYLERGAATNLAAGYHWIEARMFEATQVAALIVSYAGPGIPKQVIPSEAFLRHEAVFTARTAPQTNAATAGTQDFSAMATNIGASGTHIFRVAVANAAGTNYGPAQSALMGSAGAFTALYFNGIGAYVDVPDSTNFLTFPGTDEFTLEAWINPATLGATQTVVSKFNHPAQREYFLALDGQGRVVFHRQGSDFASVTNVAIGQYTHVAATYDGPARRIYINGQLDPALDPGSAAITNRNAPFLIGARYWFNSLTNFFQGVIDDVRVWQVARSQLQIQADMNRRLSGYELGLIAYYRFDEAQGAFTADSTVYENVGVLRNAPVFVPSLTQFACTNAPPVLNIEMLDFAPGVILWWPITCNEYVLEEAYTPGAPPENWYPVLEPITPIGDTYLMVVLWDRYEDGFFRLRRR